MRGWADQKLFGIGRPGHYSENNWRGASDCRFKRHLLRLLDQLRPRALPYIKLQNPYWFMLKPGHFGRPVGGHFQSILANSSTWGILLVCVHRVLQQEHLSQIEWVYHAVLLPLLGWILAEDYHPWYRRGHHSCGCRSIPGDCCPQNSSRWLLVQQWYFTLPSHWVQNLWKWDPFDRRWVHMAW